jgi:hypothetical protein
MFVMESFRVERENDFAVHWFDRPFETLRGNNRAELEGSLCCNRMHVYEIGSCKDYRGIDLISDALPFGRLWYGEPNAVTCVDLFTGIKASAPRSLTGICPTRVQLPVVTSHVSSHRRCV